MRIDIDLSTVPPTVVLVDPQDFGALSIAVSPADHAFIAPEVLVALAGPLSADAAWRQRLEHMLAYAEGKGWRREDGAIRAHVER